MRISEISRRTGVSVRSLRYYEQKRLLCSRRLENGKQGVSLEVNVEKFSFAEMPSHGAVIS